MEIGILMIVYSPFLAILPVSYLAYWFIKNRYLGEANLPGTWSKGLLILFFWAFIVGVVNLHGMSVLASFAFLGYFLISVYTQDRFSDQKEMEKLFLWTFVLTIGSAFLGILEDFYLINREPAWWKYLFGLCTVIKNKENLSRITGTFGNPNLAASWYAVMVLVGFYFAEQAEGKRRLAFVMGLLLCLTSLVMTESRGALVGLFLGLTVYEYFSDRKKPVFWRVLFPFLCFIFMIIYSLWCPRGDFLLMTIDVRQGIWENCFNMYLKKPVAGWGLMGIYFADNNVYQYLRVLHAHNVLLSFAVMLGTVGLGIFGWMEWNLLKDIRVLNLKDCRLVPLLAGIHAVLMGHGLFDCTIMGQQIGILFVGTSALIGGLARSFNNAEQKLRISPAGTVTGTENKNCYS